MNVIQINLESGEVLQFLNAELDTETICKRAIGIRFNRQLIVIPEDIVDQVFIQELNNLQANRN